MSGYHFRARALLGPDSIRATPDPTDEGALAHHTKPIASPANLPASSFNPASMRPAAESFWQAATEALEQDRQGAIGAHDAAQSQFAAGRRRRRQDDIVAGDGGEVLEEGARTVAETGAAPAIAPASSTARRREAHQDVRQHAILALMPDGTN
jgi:hypothetical protein